MSRGVRNLGVGEGRGRGGPRQGYGGPVFCKCVSCGYKVSHRRGSTCTSMRCPKCGGMMIGSNS